MTLSKEQKKEQGKKQDSRKVNTSGAGKKQPKSKTTGFGGKDYFTP